MSDVYMAQIKDELSRRFTAAFSNPTTPLLDRKVRVLQMSTDDEPVPIGFIVATQAPEDRPAGTPTEVTFHLQLPPRYGKRRMSGHFAKKDCVIAEEFITDFNGKKAWVERHLTLDVLQCTLEVIQQLFNPADR